MKVHVLLADKGTTNPQAGTLNLLNLGWGMTPIGPGGITPPHAVAVFFEAELSECNRTHKLEIELVDQDGKVVEVPGPAGPQPMRIEQPLLIVPPPVAPTGTPGKGNALFEMFPGLPLQPGVYRWRVKIDGHERDDWTVTFFVAAPPGVPTFGFGPQEPAAE